VSANYSSLKVMKIRQATKNDISQLLPLLAELGYPAPLEELIARFQRFLQHSGNGVAVCEKNKQIIGFVAWSKSNLFVADVTKLRIEALLVTHQYRGQGIGKKLMGWVEKTAHDHRPSIVELTSGLRRAKDGSHEFYRKLGYKNEGPMAKLYLRKEF
jgi:N-acetylglutamate synthase-like GNAT family acetyltransferase